MQASKVFISHSHKDQLIARSLVDLLEQVSLGALHTASPLYDEIKKSPRLD